MGSAGPTKKWASFTAQIGLVAVRADRAQYEYLASTMSKLHLSALAVPASICSLQQEHENVEELPTAMTHRSICEAIVIDTDRVHLFLLPSKPIQSGAGLRRLVLCCLIVTKEISLQLIEATNGGGEDAGWRGVSTLDEGAMTLMVGKAAAEGGGSVVVDGGGDGRGNGWRSGVAVDGEGDWKDDGGKDDAKTRFLA
uniref:Uncharacterized protein n=1 Tax=Oryza brachyantha TaxID=4533 RepID=J3L9A6_ORYBR